MAQKKTYPLILTDWQVLRLNIMDRLSRIVPPLTKSEIHSESERRANVAMSTNQNNNQ